MLKIEASQEITPVIEDYQPKERSQKAIEEMTIRELADELNKELKRLEKNERESSDYLPSERSLLFESGATESGRFVSIWYVSFQYHSSISKEAAQKLLAHLRTIEHPKNMKRHYAFLEKK